MPTETKPSGLSESHVARLVTQLCGERFVAQAPSIAEMISKGIATSMPIALTQVLPIALRAVLPVLLRACSLPSPHPADRLGVGRENDGCGVKQNLNTWALPIVAATAEAPPQTTRLIGFEAPCFVPQRIVRLSD